MQIPTSLKLSLCLLAIMSIVFMPLANRQSVWMMVVIIILFGFVFFFAKDKLFLSMRISQVCKMSLVWIIVYSVYFIYTIIVKGSDGVRIYYFSSIIWLLGGILFYSFSLKDTDEQGLKLLIHVAVFFLFILLVRVIYLYIFKLGGDGVSEEFKNTIPYYLLFLSTPIFLISQKRKYLLIGIVVFIILLTTKRGPLLAMLISGIVTYFLLSNRSLIFKVISIILIGVIAVTVGFVLFPEIVGNVVERFNIDEISSVEDLDRISSSRFVFWAILYDYWSQADSFTKFFGFGLNAVPEYLEMLTFNKLRIYAHSDWVDTMFNIGQFGLCLFIFFHLSMIKEIIKALKYKNKYAKFMLYNYLLFAFSNLYTGALVSFTTVWFAMFFYYFAAKTRKNDFNNNSSI